jgi:hypothetical protein
MFYLFALFFGGWAYIMSRFLLSQTVDIDFVDWNATSSDLGRKPINFTAVIDPASQQLIKIWVRADNTSTDWWESYVDRIAQPFHPWNGTSTEWCQGKKDKRHGLMLAKVFKAASTTSAGITLRIANRVGTRQGRHRCQVSNGHDFTLRNLHSHRNVSNSFLWGTVREPHSRANSAMFYYNASLATIDFLESTIGNQLRQMRRREQSRANKLHVLGGSLAGGPAGFHNSIVTEDPHKLAFVHVQEQVLQFYDFVAVTERWEESMVVLKYLLNIEYSDLIVLKAKESGGYAKKGRNCRYVPKATSSSSAQLYLETAYRQNNPDYLLYAAVNRSLDLTIAKLGWQRIEEGVRELRRMQSLAEEKCLKEAIFPCSSEGKWQKKHRENCYENDQGCGYRCVDEVLDEPN